MHLDFTGRRVVVTGGTRGIGRAIALAFAAAGADVSVCARRSDGLDDVARALAAHGHRVHTARCDLAEADQIDAYIGAAAAELGGIDVLVNNASGFGLPDDEAAWQASTRIDLMATVRAGHAALPHLRTASASRRSPSIINIASISGFRPNARTPAYAAVKAAVIHYTGSHALALAPERIRVNAIAPGAIVFPGGTWDERRRTDPALYQRIEAGIPFGALGAPEDVAHAAVFLASEQARWITGQTLTVDGGQVLV
ncbi:SDR family NAD(P)-dependent oxidoreductase [Chitinasiproducens palmae]|uniref:3-oxoacyl-[acyl-carrier protein] reductase n=1 Tax=Chitinasiproducens palmae TaxID=1770053 RepID=A0A1H2PW56_9BURK|nr:SDR family NAD(P)-dependent oxidoreductase [Chitinasiproducens palmae]SDV50742.1 3-oxoacyl-[acyl-carrier protein] reductase [Chitinasiproducens palmae]